MIVFKKRVDAVFLENDVWPELDFASNKHEIKFSGDSFNEKLEKCNGLLPKTLFGMSLNFLELSNSTLNVIPSEIGDLNVLTNLVLRSNHLTNLPSSVGRLTKLKYLDFSNNQIVEIPNELGSCLELQTLNAAHNKISELPSDFTNLIHLAHLDLSFNEFSTFPVSICDENLQHLAEINLKSNKIQTISTEISRISSLKILNLADNCVDVVPGELGDCQKLKEIYLENNKLKDKRLSKLILQCQQKSILDYIRKNCPKLKPAADKSQKTKNDVKDVKKKKDKQRKTSESVETETVKDKIIILPSSEDFKITVSELVVDVRPFILCCVLKNLNFSDGKNLKKFIALQVYYQILSILNGFFIKILEFRARFMMRNARNEWLPQ